jgi:serine/threonine-protein kinase SRK2
VALKEVFLTPKHLGIAMEYVAGGNLYQKVRKERYIREPQARWLFQQLIIALDYAHRRVGLRASFLFYACAYN